MRKFCFALQLIAIATVIPGFSQDVPEPQKAEVPFYMQPGATQTISLERQTASVKVTHGMATAEIRPEKSPVRISETRPRFLVKLTRVPDQIKLDQLVILDSASGKRTARFTVMNGLAYPMVDKQIQFEFKKFGNSSYVIRPVEPLHPGEYYFGFGVTPVGYFFGIEEGAVASTEDKLAPVAEPAKPEDPNQERLKKLDALLAKGLIEKADYDARKEEILHPPAAKPVTTEDRLRKLDDLFKKGMIEKPEYDKKRAEILSEM